MGNQFYIHLKIINKTNQDCKLDNLQSIHHYMLSITYDIYYKQLIMFPYNIHCHMLFCIRNFVKPKDLDMICNQLSITLYKFHKLCYSQYRHQLMYYRKIYSDRLKDTNCCIKSSLGCIKNKKLLMYKACIHQDILFYLLSLLSFKN